MTYSLFIRSFSSPARIPEIFIEGGNRFALEDQSVSFACAFKGQPFPKTSTDIKWFWLLDNVVQESLTTPDIVLNTTNEDCHECEVKCRAQYFDQIEESLPVNLYIGKLISGYKDTSGCNSGVEGIGTFTICIAVES